MDRVVVQGDLSDIVDRRIKDVGKGAFRSRLAIEDVDTRGMQPVEVVTQAGPLETVFMCVDDPIHVPIISHFRKGVTSDKDPYLEKLIEHLMFFNRKIDNVGIKKMTEYLVRVHVRKRDEVPVLRFEDLHDKVHDLVEKYRHATPPTYRRISVLYKRDTMLSASERRNYSLQTSRARLSVLKGELIHMAALTAIEVTQPELKITKPRVLREVYTDGINSVRTLKNHMREETVDMLNQVNASRNFLSEKTLEKFYEYLQLPPETTTREAADILNISLSTVADFKKEENK